MGRYDRLSGTRIVTTLPPREANRGHARTVATIQVEAMRAKGAVVLPVDTGWAYAGDLQSGFKCLAEIAAFKPDLVLPLPTATHGLIYRFGQVDAQGWASPNNLFVDQMGLPTILMWDGVIEMFVQMRVPTFEPDASVPGMLARLRDQLKSPLYYHYAFDAGNVEKARQLGVLDTDRVRWGPAPAYGNHADYGLANPLADSYDRDVAFTGNLFMPTVRSQRYAEHAAIRRFEEVALAGADQDLNRAYWRLIEAGLDSVDPASRAATRLDWDESFFWNYLGADFMAKLTTRTRLNALKAIRHDVAIFGLQHHPEAAALLAGSPHLRFEGSRDFVTEMPALNARTKVTVDVINVHLPTTTTAKVLGCFASGGVCLFNAKPLFRDTFGPAADAVMFRDVDDLNAKLDRLLTHDAERREIAAHFKHEVLANHKFIDLIADLVTWVMDDLGR
jgi:hypothetical protein